MEKVPLLPPPPPTPLLTAFVRSVPSRRVFRRTERGILVELVGVYRRRAFKSNLTWDLSFDEAVALFKRECFYCGVPPSNRFRGFYYNGIDRIDNTRGYTVDNCVTCCHRCNTAKSDMDVFDFLSWVAWVGARAPIIIDRLYGGGQYAL